MLAVLTTAVAITIDGVVVSEAQGIGRLHAAVNGWKKEPDTQPLATTLVAHGTDDRRGFETSATGQQRHTGGPQRV